VTADGPFRIKIERERTLLFVDKQLIRGWCERCGQEVELAPMNEIEPFLHSAQAWGCEKSKARPHLKRVKEGFVVCLRSLLLLVRAARRG